MGADINLIVELTLYGGISACNMPAYMASSAALLFPGFGYHKSLHFVCPKLDLQQRWLVVHPNHRLQQCCLDSQSSR